MKKQITFLTALTFLSFVSFAQSISPQVLGTNGAFLTGSGYSISYTTGQPASSTLTAGSSIITQGFQQPNDAYTGVQTFAAPAINVQLYPNPTNNEINLVVNLATSGEYTIELHDLLGRVLQQPIITQVASGQSNFVFDVHQLPASMYFITIRSKGSNVTHTFKFNKIN